MKVYICTSLVDIETPVVGVFATEAAAMKFARRYADKHGFDGESLEESVMVEAWDVRKTVPHDV